MEKSTISVGSADFIVRTLDVRRLPGFESDAYAEVLVADGALWDAIEQAIMAGDYDACKIDDEIFFYVETEFINQDPTDEQLLDYLLLHMCDITKFEPVSKPEAVDLYTIENDGSGRKKISILGFTYHGDNWKTIDVSGICLPLDEFIEGITKNEDYVNSLYEGCREYEEDVTDDQCVNAINHFFGGKPADYRLLFDNVTNDTPVGNYINAA